MTTDEPKPEFEYIIDLPDAYELCFNVATPQYNLISKRALTRATTAKAAVGNIIFRVLKDKNVGRRIMATLRDSRGGTESYAFIVPEVKATDGGPLSQLEMEICREGFLAEEIAEKRGGTAVENLPYARELLEFRRQNRTIY